MGEAIASAAQPARRGDDLIVPLVPMAGRATLNSLAGAMPTFRPCLPGNPEIPISEFGRVNLCRRY